MKRIIYTAFHTLLILSLPSGFAMENKPSSLENQPNEEWVLQVKDRGNMLHWDNLDIYLKSRAGQKTYLVVGCGHGAFSYNVQTGKVTGVHSYDRSSKNHLFSHPEAYTINSHDGEIGFKLFADSKGEFPKSLPSSAKEAFDEVYLENVNGGTSHLYPGALIALKPGGTLVDDRYSETTNKAENKNTVREILHKRGFEDIRFEDFVENPRNGRTDNLVIAAKPLHVRVAPPEELVQELLVRLPDPWIASLAPPERLRPLLKDSEKWSNEQIASANKERSFRLNMKR